MEQLIMLMIVLLLGGICIALFVFLVPLINQLKKTAQQLENTASSLDKLLNNELKSLLNQGGKILEDWEKEIQPLILEKARSIPFATAQFAFSEVGGRLLRFVVVWALKELWGKIRGKGEKKSY